jgi:hypothetical protein
MHNHKSIEVSTELPVFLWDLEEFRPQLQLAREAIDELRLTHPDSPESNVKANYMSPWHSHTINPKLKPLTEVAVNAGREVSKTLSANLASLNMDLIVTDCWGAVYERSNHTQKHNHFPSDLSCVIYLEASSDSAPIVFGGKLHIKPYPNLMVMFPGILVHEVPPTDGRRVMVAMNLQKIAVFAGIAAQLNQAQT